MAPESPIAPVPEAFVYFTDGEHDLESSDSETDYTASLGAMDVTIDQILDDFDYDAFEAEMNDTPKISLRKPEDRQNTRSTIASESEFRIPVKEGPDGLPDICPDCIELILHLQERRRYPQSPKWKTVPELLYDRAYEQCRLCELVASAPAILLDVLSEKDEIPLKPLREYEPLFTEFVDISIEELTPDLEPIEVFRHLNGVERTCEIAFRFKFRGRPAEVILAVWLEPLPETEYDPLRRFYNPQPERCEGVRTSSDITWREPLRKNTSWRTFELFQSWMSTCLTDHYQCTLSLAGEQIDDNWERENLGDTVLPSRVLDVFGEEEDVVKLVETSRLSRWKAPYVALSHCWGPPDKQPLTTTRANFQDHTDTGIPLSSFPKTFRDAIHITRQLDIQYLWIDSLCIIQDDESDWLAESEVMGVIYHEAAVTIAASDAKNSTEGCFVANRGGGTGTAGHGHNAPTAKFPMRKGETGNIFKTCFAHVPTSPRSEPYFSPLGHRAWVCQEWYLSRRVIFCTKAGFMWKCREIQHNERGRYFDMREERDWANLMERYSETFLTRETDRLIAVQGIANELGKTESYQDQEYHYGHWIGSEDTAIMLCWMMRGWVSDLDGKGPTGVPSWSWASITGAKLFCRTLYQFFYPSRTLVSTGDISVSADDGGKSLHIKNAHSQKAKLALLEDNELDCHPTWTKEEFWSPEALFIGRRRQIWNAPIHVILSNDDTHSDSPTGSKSETKIRIIGFAAFDRTVTPEQLEKISIIPLVESPRFGLDPYIPEGADMIWHKGEDMGSQRKLYFLKPLGPETKGFSAKDIKEQPLPVRYSVFSRAGPGTHKPVGSYTPPSPEEAKALQDHPDARYVYDAGQGKSIFWALLVEQVTDTTTGVESGSFRRVGMALIGNDNWAREPEIKDIKIV